MWINLSLDVGVGYEIRLEYLWASKISWLLLLVPLAFKDWEYFFPLSSQTDLRFQITGEGLEILALILVFLLLRIYFKERSDAEPFSATFHLRAVLAVYFATVLLTTFWRDFFPNDQFSLSAGSKDFLYASLGGLGILGISYISEGQRGKPSKKEERSAV